MGKINLLKKLFFGKIKKKFAKQFFAKLKKN